MPRPAKGCATIAPPWRFTHYPKRVCWPTIGGPPQTPFGGRRHRPGDRLSPSPPWPGCQPRADGRWGSRSMAGLLGVATLRETIPPPVSATSMDAVPRGSRGKLTTKHAKHAKGEGMGGDPILRIAFVCLACNVCDRPQSTRVGLRGSQEGTHRILPVPQTRPLMSAPDSTQAP